MQNKSMNKGEYCVYIMTNRYHTTLYTGVTNDLQRRVYEHKNHVVKGFTSKYKVEKTGRIEDIVRNQYYLLLSFFGLGEFKKAAALLSSILTHLEQPKHYVPSMSTANTLSKQLQPLAKNKEFGERISQLNKELAKFRRLTQKNRRVIRKHASIIPFQPAKIVIRSFGIIEVIANNKLLTISDWMTQTSRDLFFLFLANPEGLTKEEVGVIMWPDSTPAELKLRFKNAIYRMRRAVGPEVVVFQDNYYLFNRAVDYEYDVQEFISAVQRAKDEKNELHKITAYENAVDIYKGKYLPQVDENWAEADREKYLTMYTAAAENLAILYMTNKNFEKALATANAALEHAPFHEPLYRITMQVYAALGNKSGISKQFNKCKLVLMNEIGAKPSGQTTALYQSLLKT